MKITLSRFFLVLISVTLMILLGSCNIINPVEEVPAYVQVDSIGVYTNETTQGTTSSNFSDFWVTVDGTFLNGYQLGAKIPVLYNGKHTLTLSAGILLNGIGGTRVPYGVFQSFDTLIDFQPGVIHKIVPRVTYYSFTHFPLIEDFDHSSFFFTNTPASTASLTIANDSNSFEGSSGEVFLDADHSFFECASNDSFDLPGGTIPTYIEINYKCNNEFTVSVSAKSSSIGSTGKMELLNVRATDSWKKIYVNLIPIQQYVGPSTDWKIYFKSSLPVGQSTAALYFDNIKLVY